MKVTESLLVANPSSTCFIGRPAHEGGEPVTLRMAIPPDFEQTTFHEEFFGRRFSVIHNRLVTGIPWPPGKRQLSFTYTIVNDKSYRTWQRALDLPCFGVHVTVCTHAPDEVSCNLERLQLHGRREVCFASTGATLPAGHVVRLELGHLPLPMMVYGRWTALTALAALICRGGFVLVRRRRIGERTANAGAPAHSSSDS
jgi:hypothetical protein